MDDHERLLDVFSLQTRKELDNAYSCPPLPDDASLAHLFRSIQRTPGLQEHLFIRYPNADGHPPGVGYAVQMVTNHPYQNTQREQIFQIHWDESGNLDGLSFHGPVNISVLQRTGNLVYAFAEQGGLYEIPDVLNEADIRQINRLFQPSTP